jgi:predicted phosphodiesterase
MNTAFVTSDIRPYDRYPDEMFDDYFVRLFERKSEYGLSCQDIADILNRVEGVEYGESKWRKEYAAFSRGMKYAQAKALKGIKNRILCISDTHVPFQLPISTYASYAGVTDILVLNGDIADCQAISRFPKTYRVSPMHELIETRQYMIDLINFIQPRRVIVNYGNHDMRFQQYIAKSLDSDLIELMPRTALEYIVVDGFYHYDKATGTKTFYSPLQEIFDGISVEYTDSWFCQVGDAIFCHPLTYASGIMKTAEKAVQYFRNEGYDFKTLVMAHTHRVGEYKQGNTVLYEQGCCCDVTKQHYADGRLTSSQKEGFIYLCQDENGALVREQSCLVQLN